MEKLKAQLKRYRYPLMAFWGLYFIGIISSFVLFWNVTTGTFGFMPSFEVLENPEPHSLSSIVYTADGEVMGKYYSQNRTKVQFDELPPHLVDALIATEDFRFYDHSGIDPVGLSTAIIRTLRGKQAGGSTITQQLTKNLFPRESNLSRTSFFTRKLREWVMAVKLESRYTKEEIIAFYLNTVEFNYQSFGVRTAAKTNFGKRVEELNQEEAATIVGMLQNPSRYNPHRFPEKSEVRRNVVLAQMGKYGYLDQEEKEELQEKPLIVRKTLESHTSGYGQYFRDMLAAKVKKELENITKPDGSNYDLYKDGLRVYTTINPKMQQYAEEAVSAHLKELQGHFKADWKGRDLWDTEQNQRLLKRTIKSTPRYRKLKNDGLTEKQIIAKLEQSIPMMVYEWGGGERLDTMSVIDSIKYHKEALQTGFLCIDPKNGHVKAWVGGADFKYFKYDHVQQGSRQVGSTFKPFVYVKAMEANNIKPCGEMMNTVQCITDEWGKSWCPENSSAKYDGMHVSIKFALANSLNVITAKVITEKTSPGAVARFVETDLNVGKEIPALPSISLGAMDIPVIKMIGAYTAFANKGEYTEPMMITRIEDKNGRVLKEYSTRKKRAFDEKYAYVLTKMLQGVVDGEMEPPGMENPRKRGTGMSLKYKYKFTGDIAGKTGTTQNHSDGWFMGYTPELLGGVWVGCDDPTIHFRRINYGQGARMALPIWAEFMQRVYADESLPYKDGTRFPEPDNPYAIDLDCSDNQSTDPTNDY